MTEKEQQAFSALVLQFLVNNMLSDIEVSYTFVVVHMQAVVPGSPSALNVTFVVSADVYSPSQEIPADFDYRENVEYGFETNMTGFLDTLPSFEENRTINGFDDGDPSFGMADDDDRRRLGIVAICIAVLALQVVLVLICIFLVRNRSKERTSIMVGQQVPGTVEESIAVVGWRTCGSSMESHDGLLPSEYLTTTKRSGTSSCLSPSWPAWLCACTPGSSSDKIS